MAPEFRPEKQSREPQRSRHHAFGEPPKSPREPKETGSTGSLFPISQEAVEATRVYARTRHDWVKAEEDSLMRHNPHLGSAVIIGAEFSGLHSDVEGYQLTALITHHALQEQSRLSGIILPQLTLEQARAPHQSLYQHVRTGGTMQGYVYDCARKIIDSEPHFREIMLPSIVSAIRNGNLIPGGFDNPWGIADMYFSIRRAVEPPETANEAAPASPAIGPEVISTTPVFPLSERIIQQVSGEFTAIRTSPQRLQLLIGEEQQYLLSNTGVWVTLETRMQMNQTNNSLIYIIGAAYTHRLIRAQAKELGIAIPRVPRSIAARYFEQALEYVKTPEDTVEDVFLRMGFDLFPKEAALNHMLPMLFGTMSSFLATMNMRDFRLGIMDTYSVLKAGFEQEQQKSNRN